MSMLLICNSKSITELVGKCIIQQEVASEQLPTSEGSLRQDPAGQTRGEGEEYTGQRQEGEGLGQVQ